MSSVYVCPSGYTYKLEYQKCYKYYDLLYTPDDAQAQCVADGGSLVNIQSQAENDYVYYTIRAPNTDILIGYLWQSQTWRQNSNNLKLLALTDGNTFVNWNTGEGTGSATEFCTGVGTWTDNTGKWVDMSCNYNYRFICNTNADLVTIKFTQPTLPPTPAPTNSPTNSPTKSPTPVPTNSPTNSPTPVPTSYAPTMMPTTTTQYLKVLDAEEWSFLMTGVSVTKTINSYAWTVTFPSTSAVSAKFVYSGVTTNVGTINAANSYANNLCSNGTTSNACGRFSLDGGDYCASIGDYNRAYLYLYCDTSNKIVSVTTISTCVYSIIVGILCPYTPYQGQPGLASWLQIYTISGSTGGTGTVTYNFGSTMDTYASTWTKYGLLWRFCGTCAPAYRNIYYRRITTPTTFTLNSYISNWISTDNLINTNFYMYGSLTDLIADTNRWQYCNYDAPYVGMFRDCGPTTSSAVPGGYGIFKGTTTSSCSTAGSYDQNIVFLVDGSQIYDFTMTFWMQTTKSGCSSCSNWYCGTGLIDGEVDGVVYDFGISLMDSKIGCGIGGGTNTGLSDITIISNAGDYFDKIYFLILIFILISILAVNDGQWHHVACVRSGTTVSIYIDGTLDSYGTVAHSLSLSSTVWMKIGRIDSGFNNFNGLMADVRIYDTANATFVSDSMNQYTTNYIGNIIRWYKLDGNAFDSSVYQIDGVSNNMAYSSSNVLYSFDIAPNSNYPDSGHELTDGVTPTCYPDGGGTCPSQWVGWSNANPTITFTFPQIATVKVITLYFTGSISDGRVPSTITVQGDLFTLTDTGSNGWVELRGSWYYILSLL